MVQSVTHLLHKLHCANYFLLMVLAKQQNLTEYRIAWNASFSAYNCQWFHYPILFYSYIVRFQTFMFFFMFYLSFYKLDPKKGKWAQIFKKSLSCQLRLRYMLLFIDIDSAIWQSNWSTGTTTPTQNIQEYKSTQKEWLSFSISSPPQPRCHFVSYFCAFSMRTGSLVANSGSAWTYLLLLLAIQHDSRPQRSKGLCMHLLHMCLES